MPGDVNLWVPLLSTTVGGGIALASAYFAARYQIHSAIKRENRERMLKKAEELYEVLLKLEHLSDAWTIAVGEQDAEYLKPDFDLSQHQIYKICLITDIYLPSLSASAHVLLEKWNEYGRFVAMYLERIAEGKPAEKALFDSCSESHAIFCDASKLLKSEISEIIQQ